jgi:folate-dependent phosphoribosylglycinamide formyltransferase PurN
VEQLSWIRLNMYKRLLILTNSRLAPKLLAAVREWADEITVEMIEDRDTLRQSLSSGASGTLLVAFGTGVIVPRDLIEALGGACFNIHPGSPEYPGRDPHHFAVYDHAAQFGATAHHMTERVDAGPIIDVELFDVSQEATPRHLLDRAEAAGCRIFDRLVPRLLRGELPVPLPLLWGSRKTTRRDFYELSQVSPVENSGEFERRRRATLMEPHCNLWTEINGYRFAISNLIKGASAASSSCWTEFTEAGYVRLLELASSRYQFATFKRRNATPHVLWRHDVDYSVHRALRLARLEHERGLVATYFFCLRLPFYNMFEPEIQRMARAIIALGHRVGLHFDASGYPHDVWTADQLNTRLDWERRCLEQLLEFELDAVSFHDPSAGGFLRFDSSELGGMVNAYSSEFRRDYGYCSDSNGYWRFAPIAEVLSSGQHAKLQVLTHPGWWTPSALSPWLRIERAVMGRARAVMRGYDEHLARSGRHNHR